jgi:hypothetical protein
MRLSPFSVPTSDSRTARANDAVGVGGGAARKCTTRSKLIEFVGSVVPAVGEIVRCGLGGAFMKHEVLGDIEQTAGEVFDGVASIRYGPRDIKVGIIRDDQPFETTMELAAEVVRRLGELDKLAKRVAVSELRETYNNGWNEYDEAQEDGSLKSVANPKLSEVEFEEKLSLLSVNVNGDRMIHFFYDDSGMFWGHTVIVYSLNGTDFSDAQAELFG